MHWGVGFGATVVGGAPLDPPALDVDDALEDDPDDLLFGEPPVVGPAAPLSVIQCVASAGTLLYTMLGPLRSVAACGKLDGI